MGAANTLNPQGFAIARTAELLGSMETLSQKLAVPVADLIRWERGEGEPPIDVFIRLVDLLRDETRQQNHTGGLQHQ